jgi:glycosyltransferase involved in cell wall biosynthesis
MNIKCINGFGLADAKIINTNDKATEAIVNNNEINKVGTTMSVVIPVLQEEKILEKHLTILKEFQSKFGFEIIVSDGGSTDETVAIAKKYADKVVVHTGEKRQTIAEGRNMGAKAASSDILVFLNGDSIPVDCQSFFTAIMDFSKKRGKYARYSALACKVSSFPEEELLKDRIFYAIHNNYVWFLNIIGLGMGRGECQIIRKEVFEAVGGFNDKIIAGEDFDLYHRISKIAKIKYDPIISVHESPRRFRKYGYIRTIAIWLINSLSVWWFGKSFSREWEAVR